ncbi:hypothetical protein LWE61_18630 [Sphingobium sufflavum]|uniref:hypothetical protein n=1 Tax=Sphingobium sufflavum TaxID=1129547 RepID=UPI001F30CC1F|nr:hypothetical protein [Sphingobium sufflavum]MCE7798552.1 hypothetical protein [Sphingobium sufflavum]
MTHPFDKANRPVRPVEAGAGPAGMGMLCRCALPLMLFLTGCNGATPSPDQPSQGNQSQANQVQGKPSQAGNTGIRTIPCGPRTGEPTESCRLEVTDRNGDLHMILRQPDGGFRRLLWPKDGALAPADGADPLETTALKGGGVEVRIGDWRYRIEKKGGGLP